MYMAEYNLKENILNTTIADMVASFSTDDLQREVPYLMEDLNEDIKRIVSEYQTFLADGKFKEAAAYRTSHSELETRIFDAYKANILMEKITYLYLYAKAQIPQIVMEEIQPGKLSINNEDDLFTGQEKDDLWIQPDSESPYDPCTLKICNGNGDYSSVALAPVSASDGDVSEIANRISGTFDDLSNPNYAITLQNLKKLNDESLQTTFSDLDRRFINECYMPFKQAIVDAYKEVYPNKEVPKEVAATLVGNNDLYQEKDIYVQFIRDNFFRTKKVQYKTFFVLIDPNVDANEYITKSNAEDITIDLSDKLNGDVLLAYATVTCDRTIDHKEFKDSDRTTSFDNGKYDYYTDLGHFEPVTMKDYIYINPLNNSTSNNVFCIRGTSSISIEGACYFTHENTTNLLIRFANNMATSHGYGSHNGYIEGYTTTTATFYVKNSIEITLIYI